MRFVNPHAHSRWPGLPTGAVTTCAAVGCVLLLGTARATAEPDEPAAVLGRAKAVMGFGRVGASVIHYRAVAAVEENYQSDRSYPPFFSAMTVEEAWLDPASGVERVSSRTSFPGSESPPAVVVTDAKRAFAVTSDATRPLSVAALRSRYLNPWAVIADWAAAGDARAGRREPYRDYVRAVLVRATPEGEQRLFVDPKSGFPVKLELVAKHYLWGQRRIEYVYSNWMRVADIMVAGASFCLADGATELSQTVGEVELIARSAAPPSALPETPERAADELPRFLQPLDVTTVPVGPDTYLLTNAGYTEAVTRVGDEVIVFDATQGEERVKKDAEAIARLFPGKHKTTVVVTDLAWPHIAGVRAWVASGATIVAHGAALKMLRSVIDRRWTLAPDVLERRRGAVMPRLAGVTALEKLAGGAITLHPIDGIGSEVALIAYVAPARFLWASDYIQTAAKPTAYASEVLSAVHRDGLRPETTAAQHLPVTPWSQIEALGP